MASIFKKTYTSKEDTFHETVKGISLFKGMTKKDIISLQSAFYKRTYQEKEVVYYRKDQSLAFYFVISGKVKIQIDIDEHHETIKNINTGDFFGENALIQDSKRLYTAVIASTEAELYVITEVQLLDLLDKNKSLKAKLMSNLAANFYNEQVDLVKTYQRDFSFFELKNVYEKE